MFSINNTISRNPVMSRSEDRVSGQQNPAATGTNSACAQGLAGHVKAVSSTRVISFPAKQLAAADEMSRELLRQESGFLDFRNVLRMAEFGKDSDGNPLLPQYVGRNPTGEDVTSMYFEAAKKPHPEDPAQRAERRATMDAAQLAEEDDAQRAAELAEQESNDALSNSGIRSGATDFCKRRMEQPDFKAQPEAELQHVIKTFYI